MWVFDGEEWTQDVGNEHTSSSSKPEVPRQRVDEFVPELQVIEILPTPVRQPVPPLPMVIP